MSQATVKELRKDLAALAKRQELFEDKILAGGGPTRGEDIEYFKQMSQTYAEEARRVRTKIMDLLSDTSGAEDKNEPTDDISTPAA